MSQARFKKVQSVCDKVAEELMQNPVVQGVGIGGLGKADLGLIVYVLPKPEDRRNFDPAKYGLKREYEGEQVKYLVMDEPARAL